MSSSDARPVTQIEFAALMERLGPFESNPEVAVAVSGGTDSMAAALLVHEWARRRGGCTIGLVVDHGLRDESADEAALVAQRLSTLGIKSLVLQWRGEKPNANVQAEARQARYQLLSDYCAQHGILHLVLGHHRDDQAETFMMRLSRGSGLYGLAAMSAVKEQADCRILRPLLTLPKGRLLETVKARGAEGVDDPSNENRKYARTRFRDLLTLLAAEGLSASRLVETSRRLGCARSTTEAAVASALARAVSLHRSGIAFLEPQMLGTLPSDVALRCLARTLLTVSGSDYGPRMERLESLLEKILGGLISGATLSGCRLVPWRRVLVICRENRPLPQIPLVAGRLTRWDDRFDVLLAQNLKMPAGQFTIGALGPEGWAQIRKEIDPIASGFPPLAGEAAIAIRNAGEILMVPHLGYLKKEVSPEMIVKCRFRPGNSLAGVAFTVA
ncbi:tRNA lysidine(34) synthetase TilS [Denitrobaculum tricleocarpae]|uniref:tRNA(Ile)-lysidine synthase n=1 Tax=Denitrobaculum tricleocarpae TaxID=2591009 RepID=A0A545TX00_9PROT|nr:tRNA lysidine(34) synthetase TilS [Denitrobaculum tricleocarpae]TQV81745.1 tRNA lysidine(34) synthetase TilS [Denitrobaculum tricleocarpae]